MAISKTWPSGSTNVTPTSYSIPEAGNVNWPSLTNFLTALADGAQSTTSQKVAVRTATTTPVTISVNDCIVATDLTAPGAVAVTLPAGVNKQIFYISDQKGDATGNNITITPDGAETINGAATFTLDTSYQGIGVVFDSAESNWIVFVNTVPVGSLSNPLTVEGDMIYASNTGSPATPARLPIGTINYVLTSNGTIPVWELIDNDMVAPSAGIAVGKLEVLTTNRAVVTDGSGFISASAVTATELGYLSGASSNIQTQINALDTDIDTKVTNPMTTTGDMIYASNTATPATPARRAIGSTGDYLRVSAGVPTWEQPSVPTIQKFTSGSGTYTTPANVKWIRVRMVGGGGGGGASGPASTTGDGGAGGNTTFGTTLLVANGGGGGKWGNTSGVGGTASLGVGPIGFAAQGNQGQGPGGQAANNNPYGSTGGGGGTTPFCGGAGAPVVTQAGVAAQANSGAGGSGAGYPNTTTAGYAGGGGSAGGYVDAIIASPSATYSYAVGAGGTAGTFAANLSGGAGGSGLIIVEEHYV